ncbi:MAG: C25 family cysteine peptidase [Bacteroidales bacterium]|nr:C25 family cysteine peptidase [Bacteroidales bacterium]MDD5974502.1 C25 family cysteine peptidase [Bacteroidales bacterium]MDY5193876.1 C25 family cysteine peptidase [Candidatus Aphodosoma sp.]
MKKLLLIISIITPIYLFGQDSLFLKCIEFPGFGIKSSIELDDSLIVNIDNDNYNIQYLLNFQSLNFRDTTINNITFFDIQLPRDKYVGYESIIGQPKLPFINFSLQIPGILYEDSIIADNIICSYEEISVNNFYLPYQDVIGKNELKFNIDDDYYRSSHELNNYVNIVPFHAGRTTGINVILKPIQYDPLSQKVRIINSITFDIPLENAQLSDVFAYEFFDTEVTIDAPFLVEDTQLPINPNSKGNLLIVIADENYRLPLNNFVIHKSKKGYSTEIISIDQIKEDLGIPNLTTQLLRNYLRNKYYSTYISSRPKFLLLVGNYNLIPYSSEDEDLGGNFYTDLYYGCLNSPQIRQESDLYPEMFVGRWPIDSINQLNTVINKTIKFENSLGESPAFYNVMMVSGIESSSNSQKENDMFSTILGMQRTLNQNSLFQNVNVYDGRNYRGSVGTDTIQNILKQKLNSNLWMFVYWGHGSIGSLGLPLSINYQYLDSYVYSDIPPIALSFACLTNRISAGNCYGKSWLIKQQNAGGVAYYGATGAAYSYLAKQLALTISSLIKANDKISIAMPLQIGAAKLYAGNHIDDKRNQAEKFCLYGDPSLQMFSHSKVTVAQQNSQQSKQKEIELLNIDLLNKYVGHSNISTYVYDINGKLILLNNRVDNNLINKLNTLPIGMYFITIVDNKSTEIYKIIINK